MVPGVGGILESSTRSLWSHLEQLILLGIPPSPAQQTQILPHLGHRGRKSQDCSSCCLPSHPGIRGTAWAFPRTLLPLWIVGREGQSPAGTAGPIPGWKGNPRTPRAELCSEGLWLEEKKGQGEDSETLSGWTLGHLPSHPDTSHDLCGFNFYREKKKKSIISV